MTVSRSFSNADAYNLLKIGLESGVIKLMGSPAVDVATAKQAAEADAMYLRTLFKKLQEELKGD